MADELDTTLSRQTASGQRHGARSTEKPLAFDYGASEAIAVLRNTLVGWVRDLEPDPGPGHDRPADRLDAMALWLLARIDALRTHPAAEEVVGEIGAAVANCTRAIDRRASMVYAGTCGHEGCTEGLYVAVGRPNVTCRGCGARYDVADRTAEILTALQDRLLTVRQCARMAAYSGEFPDTRKTENLLNKWVQRSILQAHGLDLKGRETYPFGDILDRLRASRARASAICHTETADG